MLGLKRKNQSHAISYNSKNQYKDKIIKRYLIDKTLLIEQN